MATKNKRTKSKWIPPIARKEKRQGEVITKPNGSQTVREILFKNTQGMAYDNYKTPFYEDQATFSSQSLNEIQEMDLSEKLQFLRETQKKAKSLENKIASYKKQQEKLEKETIEAKAKAIADQELAAIKRKENQE